MKKRSLARRWRKFKFAVRTRSLGEMVRLQIVEKAPLYHVTEYYVKNRQLLDRAYRILAKEYRSILDSAPEAKAKNGEGIPKIVWWCWLQGIESAPELVKVCFESVRENMPGYELRVITEENYRDYVELPDVVLKRRRDGLMSANHFANLLRLELLLRYGGVWVDATVLMTGTGLCEILDQTKELFMPSITYNFYGFTAENWLIAARPDNEILRLTQRLHYAYWKDHKIAINYWFFFLFFTMATQRYPEQWREVYPYCRELSFLLAEEMDRPFSQQRYDVIRKLTSIHKLSWKRKFSAAPGSYYDELIRQRRYGIAIIGPTVEDCSFDETSR